MKCTKTESATHCKGLSLLCHSFVFLRISTELLNWTCGVYAICSRRCRVDADGGRKRHLESKNSWRNLTWEKAPKRTRRENRSQAPEKCKVSCVGLPSTSTVCMLCFVCKHIWFHYIWMLSACFIMQFPQSLVPQADDPESKRDTLEEGELQDQRMEITIRNSPYTREDSTEDRYYK